MNKELIAQKATTETIEVSIQKNIVAAYYRLYPKGVVIVLPELGIDQVIQYCDLNNYPVYKVTNNKVAVAGSYTQLSQYLESNHIK